MTYLNIPKTNGKKMSREICVKNTRCMIWIGCVTQASLFGGVATSYQNPKYPRWSAALAGHPEPRNFAFAWSAFPPQEGGGAIFGFEPRRTKTADWPLANCFPSINHSLQRIKAFISMGRCPENQINLAHHLFSYNTKTVLESKD